MSNAVFVYADGQVGCVSLPVTSPRYRRVVRPVPFVSVVDFSPPLALVNVETEEFDVRGRMFDGRPIYCASGFDVQTVLNVRYFSTRAMANGNGQDELRRTTDQFVRKEFPGAIDLDHWEGELPLTPEDISDGLAAARLVKMAARRLVAVRKVA